MVSGMNASEKPITEFTAPSSSGGIDLDMIDRIHIKDMLLNNSAKAPEIKLMDFNKIWKVLICNIFADYYKNIPPGDSNLYVPSSHSGFLERFLLYQLHSDEIICRWSHFYFELKLSLMFFKGFFYVCMSLYSKKPFNYILKIRLTYIKD